MKAGKETAGYRLCHGFPPDSNITGSLPIMSCVALLKLRRAYQPRVSPTCLALAACANAGPVGPAVHSAISFSLKQKSFPY